MSGIRLTGQQRAAVEDRGGNLLVSAAAGSGKTRVLVERLFRYVTEEHCHLDDFLIITYTRAAAAELRGRIAQELGERLAGETEDYHLQQQLYRVYRADIKTVDAFCTALLRENVHLLESEGPHGGCWMRTRRSCSAAGPCALPWGPSTSTWRPGTAAPSWRTLSALAGMTGTWRSWC